MREQRKTTRELEQLHDSMVDQAVVEARIVHNRRAYTARDFIVLLEELLERRAEQRATDLMCCSPREIAEEEAHARLIGACLRTAAPGCCAALDALRRCGWAIEYQLHDGGSFTVTVRAPKTDGGS